jgi:hypothetical protein
MRARTIFRSARSDAMERTFTAGCQCGLSVESDSGMLALPNSGAKTPINFKLQDKCSNMGLYKSRFVL